MNRKPPLAHKVVKPAPYFSEADHGTDIRRSIRRERAKHAAVKTVFVGRVAFGKLEAA